MKYIKIKGYQLEEVFPKLCRKMNTETFIVYANQQMIDKDKIVSYGLIREDLIPNHESVTIFNTIDQVNLDIDAEYDEIFILKDITKLQVDLNLSGNPTIDGYDPNKEIESQTNLKALYDANMGGIVKNKKAEYFK